MDGIKVKRLSEQAILPTKAFPDEDAGYDLFTPVDFTLEPGQRLVVDLEIAMQIPFGVVGVIKSRSGVASKLSCDVGAGVIDPGYRGSVGVLLCNNGKQTAVFAAGDRIAQILFLLCFPGSLVEVAGLAATERGAGGFGSTDKRKEDPVEQSSPKRSKSSESSIEAN